MKVVHLAERIAPFWPASADSRAAAELPLAQQHGGDDLCVVGAAPVSSLEDFSSTQQFARRLEPLVVSEGGASFEVTVLESTLQGSGIRLYLLVLPEGQATTGFGRAATALLASLPDAPELLHLHGDTGLDVDGVREQFAGPAVVQSVYQPRGTEGLAAAIHDADEVVTPCHDLVEAAGDANGDPVAQALAEHSRVRVVSCGIDLNRWDPSSDSALPSGYDLESTDGKAACKEALLARAGLPPRPDVPVVCVWSTGDADSGLDLVAAHVEELLAQDVLLVTLCDGDVDDALSAALSGDRCWLADGSDRTLLRQVLAGSDVVLLPDRSAPLGQRALVAARYGLVPVARRVNAHADRLVEYDGLSNTGGAFLFDDPEAEELVAAFGRMRRTFGSPEAWSHMVRANGAGDLGWRRTAAQLQAIYGKALAR